MTYKHLQRIKQIRRQISGLDFDSVYSEIQDIELSLTADMSRPYTHLDAELIMLYEREMEQVNLTKQQLYN
jgi:hypothetical protein